jgi:hypothetical protein
VAGRSPKEAVTRFVDPIRRATACFLGAAKVTVDNEDPNIEGVLTLNHGNVVALPKATKGGPKVSISIVQRYRIVQDDVADRGPWKVSTTAWNYQLQEDGKPTLDFHWHPDSRSRVLTPHLHVRSTIRLKNRHVPTGRVLVEDVLGLAIELGAAPRDPKAWARVEKRNRDAFLRGATWGRHAT